METAETGMGEAVVVDGNDKGLRTRTQDTKVTQDSRRPVRRGRLLLIQYLFIFNECRVIKTSEIENKEKGKAQVYIMTSKACGILYMCRR